MISHSASLITGILMPPIYHTAEVLLGALKTCQSACMSNWTWEIQRYTWTYTARPTSDWPRRSKTANHANRVRKVHAQRPVKPGRTLRTCFAKALA
jgi:hypothetical protein